MAKLAVNVGLWLTGVTIRRTVNGVEVFTPPLRTPPLSCNVSVYEQLPLVKGLSVNLSEK